MEIRINPFPKQQEAWEALLSDKFTYVIYGGAAGGGKRLSLDTKIPTPTGWVLNGDLKDGDIIFSEKGLPIKIIKAHDITISENPYRLTFDDGSFVDACEEHLWNTYTASDLEKMTKRGVALEMTTKTTKEIVDTLKIRNGSRSNHAIPVTKPLELPHREFKIDPYLLGVWLGDGVAREGIIGVAKTDIDDFLNYIKRPIISLKYQNGNFVIARFDGLQKDITEIGLKNNKHIPNEYLWASKEQRLELLKGLMDTDGCVVKDGGVEFCNTNERIIDGVYQLIVSLGWKVTKREKKVKLYGKDCGLAWILKWTPDQYVFNLKRKKEKQKLATRRTTKFRYIVKAEKLPPTPMRCITVDNPTSLYLCGDAMIPTHNSWLGCEWLLVMCLKYPGSRWFIGRDELKKIMTSAFITFTKVCNYHKIPQESWKVNGQYNYIEFSNGSRIDLLDMKLLPTDPMFERFGSMEYTGGWLEEAGELHANAFEILKSRIGRHMSDECPPKILITCNPKKNWLYYDFYLPWREDKLPSDSCFIPALFGDNPYTRDVYGKQLSNLRDNIMRQRLEYGNWDYDDDNTSLLSYDEILMLFSNKGKIGDKYMTVDPAFGGKDEAVIMLWNGWVVYKIISVPKTDHGTLMQLIDLYSKTENIPKRNIVSDAGGEGGYLPKLLKGIRGFLAGSSSLTDKKARFKEMEKPYFANLRTQCIYEMAHLIKTGVVQMATEDQNIKTKIIQELQQWKVKSVDDDKKTAIIGKDEIRRTIGRSTDYSDALYMRMFFDLDPERPGITLETAKKQIEQQQQKKFDPYGI